MKICHGSLLLFLIGEHAKNNIVQVIVRTHLSACLVGVKGGRNSVEWKVGKCCVWLGWWSRGINSVEEKFPLWHKCVQQTQSGLKAQQIRPHFPKASVSHFKIKKLNCDDCEGWDNQANAKKSIDIYWTLLEIFQPLFL